jgi:anionic cell wall polymer biosynthesis LytR-Cps2A-Psr (LCP) family protein
MDEILNALKETDKPTTVADLVGILSNTNIVITTSKATALLGKLLSEQKVNREKIKGRPYYSVAE